jgi:tetratricopeptide (TPR) repeat protein
MRIAVVMAVVGFVAGTARAERRMSPLSSSCTAAAARVTKALGATPRAEILIEKRCQKDRWSQHAQSCFSAATTNQEAQPCLDRLTKDQRTSLEGDADRLADPRLQKFLLRLQLVRPQRLEAPRVALPPDITLAVLSDVPDFGKVRVLERQGYTAYQAGRYDFAVRKLSAAVEANPSPALIYHLAQAYRLKGDRAKALEHYERYLEIAPDGAAASACHAQIEKLRDDVP